MGSEKKEVKIGVVPSGPGHSQFGVMIGTVDDPKSRVVVAPDEARTLAELQEDPEIGRQLREVALRVETVLADARIAGKSFTVVAPRLAGPEGLGYWMNRYHPMFRSCYRSAVGLGYPADIVMLASPSTDSLDDPPTCIQPYRIREARTFLGRRHPTLKGSLDAPSRTGFFYVVASREAGRFQGTHVGMMPMPGPDDDLPPPIAIYQPKTEAN